jgi:carbamoyltransferase
LRERFGPRERGAALSPQHFDIASSLQAVLEETVLGMARVAVPETRAKHLCMAGGWRSTA